MGAARTVSFLQSLSWVSSSGETYSPPRKISTHQFLAMPQLPSLSLTSQKICGAQRGSLTEARGANYAEEPYQKHHGVYHGEKENKAGNRNSVSNVGYNSLNR